jgi:hypothetical protein
MTTHFPYFNKKWRVKIFPLCQIYKIVICPGVLVSFFFWPLYCISSFDIRLLVTPVVSSNFWPLHCMYFFELRRLITPSVSSTFSINIVHRDMKRESLNSDCQQLHRRQNEQSPLTLTKLTACRYLPVFNLTTPMWTMLKKYMINGKKK